ncbi:MAG: helix-turn-helix domain-containing protein [Pseudomonadota bacterium]|nr:helix-turn-helix domain-containing protein [Pseudomonadota bacterium]
MRWDDLAEQPCAIARTSAVIGDRWTMLILRDCFMGVRRFEAFQQRLGISRTVVTDRLAVLVREGVLRKVRYQDRPERFEYRLTEKGLDLYPLLLAMFRWGEKHYGEDAGPFVIHRHKTCGHDFHAVCACSECGEPVDPRQVEARAGPGMGGRPLGATASR